jgi:hypothetical protein
MSAHRILAAGFAIVTLIAATLTIGQIDVGSSAQKAYLGHLSTDKPIYRAGERVYLREVVLGATDHVPLPSGTGGYATIEIKGPKGEQLFNEFAEILIGACRRMRPVDSTQQRSNFRTTVSRRPSGSLKCALTARRD